MATHSLDTVRVSRKAEEATMANGGAALSAGTKRGIDELQTDAAAE